MVHVAYRQCIEHIQRHRPIGTERLSSRSHNCFEQVVEFSYVVGSISFVIGSFFFLPSIENTHFGCICFEVGSVIFLALSCYVCVDGLVQHHATRREILEQVLYTGGSLIFLLGTFLFDPWIVDQLVPRIPWSKDSVLNVGAALFMIGSVMFATGAYVNALGVLSAGKAARFKYYALTITTTFQYGGFCFIAGTMGYVASFHPNESLKRVATWFYILGSCFYTVGCIISYMRCVVIQKLSSEEMRLIDEEEAMFAEAMPAAEAAREAGMTTSLARSHPDLVAPTEIETRASRPSMPTSFASNRPSRPSRFFGPSALDAVSLEALVCEVERTADAATQLQLLVSQWKELVKPHESAEECQRRRQSPDVQDLEQKIALARGEINENPVHEETENLLHMFFKTVRHSWGGPSARPSWAGGGSHLHASSVHQLRMERLSATTPLSAPLRGVSEGGP